MNMKLLVHCPNPSDATSFYRGIEPLSHLHGVHLSRLNLQDLQEVKWSDLSGTIGVFIQRPFLECHLNLLRMAKAMNLPVWIDYDDDLLNIPVTNPCYAYYEPNLKNIKACLNEADIVTVSTHQLSEEFKKFNVNTIVIPNAFNDFLFNRQEKKKEKNRTVLWRGTATHQEDLYAICKDLSDIAFTFPEWKFLFIGDNPWFIKDLFCDQSQFLWSAGMDILTYFHWISGFQAAIQIVPLNRNKFNLAKSNIAWIEGSFAHSQVLAPALPEWIHPGMNLYTHEDNNFKERLMEMMQKPKEDHSWTYIENNLSLSVVNQQRSKIIKAMMKHGSL